MAPYGTNGMAPMPIIMKIFSCFVGCLTTVGKKPTRNRIFISSGDDIRSMAIHSIGYLPYPSYRETGNQLVSPLPIFPISGCFSFDHFFIASYGHPCSTFSTLNFLVITFKILVIDYYICSSLFQTKIQLYLVCALLMWLHTLNEFSFILTCPNAIFFSKALMKLVRASVRSFQQKLF